MRRIRDNRTVRAYTTLLKVRKARIKALPRKRRFWAWLWVVAVMPWALVVRHFRRDPWLIAHFLAWFAIVSCEVWFPYLMGLITLGSDRSAWWFGIGSACWLFWAGPGTPFMAIVLALSVASNATHKAIRKRLRERRSGKSVSVPPNNEVTNGNLKEKSKGE